MSASRLVVLCICGSWCNACAQYGVQRVGCSMHTTQGYGRTQESDLGHSSALLGSGPQSAEDIAQHMVVGDDIALRIKHKTSSVTLWGINCLRRWLASLCTWGGAVQPSQRLQQT